MATYWVWGSERLKLARHHLQSHDGRGGEILQYILLFIGQNNRHHSYQQTRYLITMVYLQSVRGELHWRFTIKVCGVCEQWQRDDFIWKRLMSLTVSSSVVIKLSKVLFINSNDLLKMLSSLRFLRRLCVYYACIVILCMYSKEICIPQCPLSISNVIPSGIVLKKGGNGSIKTYLKNRRDGLQCWCLFSEKFQCCLQDTFWAEQRHKRPLYQPINVPIQSIEAAVLQNIL